MGAKNYNKGDVIFRQGDAGESMFSILRGSVGVYLDYGTEQQKKLTELSGDGFFGEMGLIDHARRSASAVALEDNTELEEITEAGLGELFRRDPDRVLAIMRGVSHRLRDLTRDYMEVCRTASDVTRLEADAAGVSAKDSGAIRAKAERYAELRRGG